MSRISENNAWMNSDINEGKYIHPGVIRQRTASTDSIIDMSKPVSDFDRNNFEQVSIMGREKKKHKLEVKKSHKKHKKEGKLQKQRREEKSKENPLPEHNNPILQLFSARIL